MTRDQARERAQQIVGNVRLDSLAPEERQYACDLVARELLLAQAEAYQDARDVWVACGSEGLTGYAGRRAAELRRDAEAI